MERLVRFLLFYVFILLTHVAVSQAPRTELRDERAKKFDIYLMFRHGGPEPFEAFKATNKYQYLKELWYYSESFYVKRNHFEKGLTLDESTIDISRFENLRKEDEETVISFADFRDVLILLPANKLIYKPATE